MANIDRSTAGAIELEGVSELVNTFDSLERKVNRQLAFKAMRKAARILIAAARAKVQGYSKLVAKSITINYTSRHEAIVGIGPKKTKKRDPWFAHFIEFGTSGVGRFKKSGRKRYRADQPARPFMRTAYDETRQQITDDFSNTVGEVIAKEMSKLRNVT